MHEVIMPKLGLTMETGTIEKWHKKEGDKIESGEILFEVMTDKVSLEVEAYNSGYLKKILRREGEEVPVTEVIAYIGDKNEEAPGKAVSAAQAAGPSLGKASEGPIMQDPGTQDPGTQDPGTQDPGTQDPGTQGPVTEGPEAESKEKIEKDRTEESLIKISPLARNIAANKGVDITKIKGTGPGGRIVREDVENFITSMKSTETGAEAVGVVTGPAAKMEAGEGTLQQKIKISPLARSVAKEMGIDYLTGLVTGTGPGGRIVKEDIIAFAKSDKAAAAAAGGAASASAQVTTPAGTPAGVSVTIPAVAAKIKSTSLLKGMRKVIAERLTYSNQYIPHIIQNAVMDVTSLITLREKIKDKVFANYGTKLTYTDFIIKACALILAEQSVVNASLQDGNHIIYEDVNVGLAVSVDSGLIVPTIYGADRLSLFDIAKKRIELVEKAKASKLTLEEISNGTFTVSNLGMFGVRSFTAIINPPQGAILMVGEIYKAPVVVEDKIEIRQQMEISIAVDHRIIDGADGSRFLMRLREILENPELLLI